MSLLTLVKGLPLAYNRDLQEDKQPLLDAFDTVSSCLAIAAPLVAETELNRSAIAERLERGHLDATTLMEYLILRGTPQRTAHGVVGKLVRLAIDRGVRLADLPLDEFQAADASLDANVYSALGVTNAINAFVSYGSTAPVEVAEQVRIWKQKLSAEKASTDSLPL